MEDIIEALYNVEYEKQHKRCGDYLYVRIFTVYDSFDVDISNFSNNFEESTIQIKKNGKYMVIPYEIIEHIETVTLYLDTATQTYRPRH